MFGRTKTQHRAVRTARLVQDDAGAPAVQLDHVRQAGHVDLVKRAEKAGISLSKRGLAGIRAQAVVVLDHSGSMASDYRAGVVQTLVERALGFALQIDVDGSVPVIAFDSRVWPAVDVDLSNYQGVVDQRIWRKRDMGSTDLAAALKQVKLMADSTDVPLFVLVITDGAPNDRAAATQVVCELAGYPAFIKMLAIRPVDYLQQLDDLPADRRLIDNVDTKFVPDPTRVSDLEFADAMTDEWPTWVAAALEAGVLTR